jgi:sugar phosphate isomerase/epimerase
MQVAFSTLGCPGWSLEQIAEAAQVHGYEAVELRVHEDGDSLKPDVAEAEASRVRALFDARDVKIASLSGYCRFTSRKKAEKDASQALMTTLLGLAEKLGVKYVRTFAGEIPEGIDFQAAAESVAKALKPLAKDAAGRGIKIALEIHDHWLSGARVMEIVDRVDNADGLGVLYDVFNAYQAEGESWAVTIQKIRKHVAYCHVKDGYRGKDGKYVYTMLGAGDLPWAKILARLKREKFDGVLSLEWEKKWIPELEDAGRVLPQYANKIRRLWQSV